MPLSTQVYKYVPANAGRGRGCYNSTVKSSGSSEDKNSLSWYVVFVWHQPSAASQASRKKLEAVFGGGDDDDASGAVPKRKLVKLDEEEAAKDESDEAEDKKRIIKSLIERIPTAKEELFAYSLDWSIVDQVGVYCLAYVLFQVEMKLLLCSPRLDATVKTEHVSVTKCNLTVICTNS